MPAVLDERQLEEERLISVQFKAFHDTLASLICLLDVVDRDRLVPEVGRLYRALLCENDKSIKTGELDVLVSLLSELSTYSGPGHGYQCTQFGVIAVLHDVTTVSLT